MVKYFPLSAILCLIELLLSRPLPYQEFPPPFRISTLQLDYHPGKFNLLLFI